MCVGVCARALHRSGDLERGSWIRRGRAGRRGTRCAKSGARGERASVDGRCSELSQGLALPPRAAAMHAAAVPQLSRLLAARQLQL